MYGTPREEEKRFLNYKRFRERDGPHALGSKVIPEGEDGCFSGLTFVTTGVLESLERDQVKELVEKYGGKLTQSVSRKTTYLLIGRDAGPAKLEKAENLGTKQINEDEFLELIKTLPGHKTSKSPVKQSRTPVKSSLKDTSRNLDSAVKPEMRKRKSEEHYSPSDQSCKKYKPEETVDRIKGEDYKMWVDKYRPTSTKQIIGQQGERSNVNKLMKWLTNWYKTGVLGKTTASQYNVNKLMKWLTNWYKNHSSGKKPQPPRWGGAADDGSFFKAALLSGPPGIGKTTSAQLVCQEAGFEYIELNASDTRSKKNLDEEISQLLGNKSLGNYFSAGSGKVSSHHVVIMDEVDGMAGNEDRGGIQELIALIKSTKIPVICICNDRSHPKMRSLVNYCFDLRFQKPRVEQLKGAMMTIAYKEGIKVEPEAVTDIIVSSNQDIRQVLHNMSLWSSKEKKLGVEQTKENRTKDIKLGPFEALRRIFSAEETKNMNINEKSNLFFQDYSLVPLFVQENYLQVKPLGAKGDIKKHLHLVSGTADNLCDGDLVEKLIRREGNWSLLPLEAIFASVIPGDIMKGYLTQMINFPSWLGKNSSRNKMDRLLQELQTHMRMRVSANKTGLNLEYLAALRDSLSRPLIEKEMEGVRDVLDVLEFYCLLKEDVDSIMELSTWPGQKDPMSKVNPKVKAAFTRTYNKEGIKTPYAVTKTKKSKRGAVKMDSDLLAEENDDETMNNEGESEDNEDITSDAMVKVKKHNKQDTMEDKPSSSKGKGRGKTTGRGRCRDKSGLK
ncbi:germ line transcription factor 1 [Tachypleus tridentatus]|uniref:germ line transcription factor 1 n=1 Tax=Tachypleus tridentatus TaxID=6853 RepID=UPI003FD00FD3